MKMSFWSHCQGLIRRLQQFRPVARPRLRRRAMGLLETLEARTLLSSTPAMVADINPGAASSNASRPVAIGSTTCFTANDGVHGQELWKSDGTAAGTMLLKDIDPGSASAYPGGLTNVNGTLFFFANDGVHGYELWKSDGTAAGTMMVADINSGSADTSANNPTDVNGTLFFTANDAVLGDELWKSDGTAAGTVLVASLSSGGVSANPFELTNVNGMLYFSAYDATNGQELWKSDGTAAGTTIVADIFPGYGYDNYRTYFPNSSNPSDLTNVNGTLYFSAYDGPFGARLLWKSDAVGTTLVKDLVPVVNGYYVGYAPTPFNPGNLTNVNGTLFFVAPDNVHSNMLWKTDGTDAGTVLVGGGSYPDSLTNVNGTLFFAEADPYSRFGKELWKSDAAGTTLVKDINPGSGGSYPSDFTNVNGTLFFSANDGMRGIELWQSDGTAAGTVMLADINPGSASTSLSNLTNANGTLFFTADDGSHGSELWTVPAGSGTPAPSLDVNGFPTTTTAGAAGSLTVTARNADGTTNAGYTDTVQFSTTDLSATIIDPTTASAVALQGFTYTFTAADAGVHIFSATLKTAGTQSLAATDTQAPAETATEGRILVQAAAASTMTATGFPSTTTAGVAHNVSVTLKDPYGNIATGYTGTVHLTSSDAKATLPANYTFTAADAGSHTFSATLKTAGTQSITVADTVTANVIGTDGSITVNAAAASQFIITVPSTIKAGVPFSLTLTVEDVYGNVVTGYTGTVRFTSSDKAALLPANYTFTASDNGVHTFTGLILRKKGKQKVTIADTLNSSLTASLTENVH